MPAQNDDATCKLCHDPSGNALAVMDAHRHPLIDSLVNAGLNFEVTSVEEGAGADLDGNLDPGERVAVTMTLQDDQGMDVDPASLTGTSVTIAGPTSNRQLLLSTGIPAEALVGPQPFTFDLPEAVLYEFAGDSDGGTGGESFATSLAPHWNGASTPTRVYRRSMMGAGTVLAAGASAFQNYVDVDSSMGFLADQVIVLDDGFPLEEEYLRIQWVDGNRLWFASPAQSGYVNALRRSHPAGASVDVADLVQLTEGVDYTLDEASGTIQESAEFGDAAVVVSYTTDFRVPAEYGPALNDSPDLGEAAGKWTGKPLVDGTYTLTVWGSQSLVVDAFGETTSYRATSPGGTADFLVGGATALEPYDLIPDAQNCYRCHQDLWFHGGGRRGLETCLACHGTAGAEDRPPYRAWGAPPTTGVQVSFREMLHKIHMGEELANASAYTVVGFGPGGPPNNFSSHHYDEVLFPALPGGVRNCTACHGANESWTSPTARDHPTDQDLPVSSWRIVCASCHDDSAGTAHMNSQVFMGIEACSACHDTGEEWNVERMHKSY